MGNLIWNFEEAHEKSINSVNFSPTGKYIVSGSRDRTIKIWDLTIGILIKTLEGHTDIVNSVKFSPDGSFIASGSRDKTIKIWDVKTGNLIKTLEEHVWDVTCVCFTDKY